MGCRFKVTQTETDSNNLGCLACHEREEGVYCLKLYFYHVIHRLINVTIPN